MPERRVPLALSFWPADNSEPVLERTSAMRCATPLSAGAAASRWSKVPAPAQRRRWTFEALLRDAEAMARALPGRFRAGDYVAVWAANSPEWILLEFGTALAGMTLVTVNPAYLANELRYVLRQSRAVGLFVMPIYRERSSSTLLRELFLELQQVRLSD